MVIAATVRIAGPPHVKNLSSTFVRFREDSWHERRAARGHGPRDKQRGSSTRSGPSRVTALHERSEGRFAFVLIVRATTQGDVVSAGLAISRKRDQVVELQPAGMRAVPTGRKARRPLSKHLSSVFAIVSAISTSVSRVFRSARWVSSARGSALRPRPRDDRLHTCRNLFREDLRHELRATRCQRLD